MRHMIKGAAGKRKVASVLRDSVFLEVTADGKRVSRKVPLRGLSKLDPGYWEQPGVKKALAADKKTGMGSETRLSQKKKQYPDGMTKGMMKPTGFESMFSEAPIKPEEAAEENEMFSSENPFGERIRLAIQMFKEKRRMHEIYAHVFNKLMRFGGVEQIPRVGQGVDFKDLTGMTRPAKLDLLATHHVPDDYDDIDKWVVDFDGLTKSFL